MTVEEFSSEFDVLIQSYSTQLQFGETDDLSFTEYEKSTFLTKAQEELVIEFYYGNSSSKYSKLKDGETDNYYIVYTNNEGNKQIYSEIDASNKVTYQWTSATVDAKVNSLNIQTDSSEACELAKELHPEILQRAVELAKIFYIGQPAEVVNSGQRSE